MPAIPPGYPGTPPVGSTVGAVGRSVGSAQPVGYAPTHATGLSKAAPSNHVAGTSTSWHVIVLWFLGAIALIALADPAPSLATGIVIVLIVGTLLNNWPIYKTYLGLP